MSKIISASNFTIDQRQKFMNITTTILKLNQRFQNLSDFSSPFDLESVFDQNQNSNWVKFWISKKIEFFDFDEKMSENVMFTINRHVFYRNVYVFIDKLKDIIFFRKKNRLRIMISQCFRERVIIWHTTELSKMKKFILKLSSSFNEKTPLFIVLKNGPQLFLLNFKWYAILWSMQRQKKTFVLLRKTFFVTQRLLIWIQFRINLSWHETF